MCRRSNNWRRNYGERLKTRISELCSPAGARYDGHGGLPPPPQTEAAGATTPTARSQPTPTAANPRAGRYLGRPATTPARQVTNQELHRLYRLRDVGDATRTTADAKDQLATP